MNFKSEKKGNILIVRSSIERLDTESAPELKGLLTFENKQGHNKILLDLSNTKFCDSSGLSAILVANRLCKDTNGVFVLTGIHPNVGKMIEIAQLDRVLLIHDTIENSLKAFE